MTFEELLASSERNRKKKKYFPERWISVGYKPERAMEIARKYFEKTITTEEIKLLTNCCRWSIDFWIVRGYMAHARRLGTTSKLSKSKESEKFFSIIEKICNYLNLNYHGGSTAEKQFCADDRAYRYDFLIPDINLVIEYNGVAWHAKENEYNFVSPKGVTYEEYWDYWNKKITFIKSQGYDVIEVFSDEKLKDRQCEINKEICRRVYESYKN